MSTLSSTTPGPTSCPPAAHECYLRGCTDDAAWEGWCEKADPFTGQRIGIMWIPVCQAHKRVLIGAQKEAS